MIKKPDTHGRPQSSDTQLAIKAFIYFGDVSRQMLLYILHDGASVDNRIKYLKKKGYIKKIKNMRGWWRRVD
jgi:Zn-dependent peptidase ImmA (M78 family)